MATDLSVRMQFRLLGPLEAWRDGEPLRLGGGRQRALLALLVIHANELVTVEALVEQLFGEQSSESAVNGVRVGVSRLRRLLEAGEVGEDGRVLQTRPGGYVLSTKPGQVDVAMFERLLRDGRERRAAGDAVSASARLREALALWRGAPLADLALVECLQIEIRRLEELRLLALMERIDANLALGAGAELVAELEGLIAANPLQERLRGQLMLALYRSGRQTDALAVYREVSELLRDELGLEPSESLGQLERAILVHDSAIDPAERAAPASSGNVPVPATPFLGRAGELAEVTALLRGTDGRLLTLTGAGGSGKTRLALQAARACAEEYPDGVWFVGFADVTDPGRIAPAICQMLGLVEQPGLTPLQRLEEYLRAREPLLVFDNLEQLTAGTAVLGELLAACPGVRMLVTSRDPLRLAGEQQYEVPVLEPEDAIELFTARARAVAPGLVIDREAVSAVCERLDRLPLAIELAAARSKVLSPADILARLERRLPVLGSGPRDAPRRQRTLQATIDWSYDLLTEEEQRLFVRLSVFAGGCTLQAAEAVCDAELDRLEALVDVLDHVEALVDKSLLQAETTTGTVRYRLLESIHDYAAEKLAHTPDQAHAARTAHRDYYLALAEDAEPRLRSAEEQQQLILLNVEHDNLRLALAHCLTDPDARPGLRLTSALELLWRNRGPALEGVRLSAQQLTRSAARQPTVERGYALSARATLLCTVSGDLVASREHSEEALRIGRSAGDDRLVLRALTALTWTLLRSGEREAALQCIDEASALADSLDDRVLPGTLALMRGTLHYHQSRDARAAFTAALRIARRHGLRSLEAVALGDLATLELRSGDLSAARSELELAEQIFDELESPGHETWITVMFGYLTALEGNCAEAARRFKSALETSDRLGEQETRVMCVVGIALMSADPGTAVALHTAADMMMDGVGVGTQAGLEHELQHADLAELRKMLGEDRFEAHACEGRHLTRQQTIALGLHSPTDASTGLRFDYDALTLEKPSV